MRNVFSVLFLSVVACTPLEDRVEIFDTVQWCSDIEDESHVNYGGKRRRGEAACVVDGDTFDLISCERTTLRVEDEPYGDPNRIRLIGPDTPELSDDECFAQEATDFLGRLITGRSVRLEFGENCLSAIQEKGDNRTMAFVFVTIDGADVIWDEIGEYVEEIPDIDNSAEIFVNELLLRAGYADMWEAYDLGGRFSEVLFDAREKAALAGEGGWTACKDADGVFPNG